jgi:hypothetical protein
MGMDTEHERPSGLPGSPTELLERLRNNEDESLIPLLGQDESLSDVIARDDGVLESLGVSHDALADVLQRIITTVLEMYRLPVSEEEIPAALARQTTFPNLFVPETLPQFDLAHLPDEKLGFHVEHFQVFVVSYKGWRECPWGDTTTGLTDLLVLNRTSGAWFTAPEIMPHLIRAHRFFGGQNSPLRTDPERLARVLGNRSGGEAGSASP